MPSTNRCLATVAVLALAASGCASRDATTAKPAGPAPVALFNGHDLAGWERRGGAAEFTVVDGCIVGESRPKTRNSFLCTTASYSNFVLELDFMIDEGFNSGIQIRSRIDGEGQKERVVGYQVEIDPSSRAWSAGIYEEGLRGWLAPLTDNVAAQQAFRHGAWNHVRIEADGPHLRTWLNGVPAAALTDDAAASGLIALQVHSVGDRTDPLRVRWRRIELTALP